MEELERLREIDHDAVQEELSAESFIGLDNDVVTSASIINDDDIVADILPDADDDGDGEDVDGDVDGPLPPRSSYYECEEALDKLHNLSLFSSHGDEIQSLTLKMEALLNKDRLESSTALRYRLF